MSEAADAKLENIRGQLKKGEVPPEESVRSFLLWFGAKRRGWLVVNRICSKLDQYGLKTVPNFEYEYLDGQIGFAEKEEKRDEPGPKLGFPESDPSYRIGRLESANVPPKSIKPDSSLQEAVTLMIAHDFSQLPVMTTSREVKGAVSWKTIGSRLALKKECNVVRECMEDVKIVSLEDSLSSAISAVDEFDFILVQAGNKEICGIITAADLSVQFGKLAEPFLLVAEIEKSIRGMLHSKFTAAELKQALPSEGDGREIKRLSDLTFGEYVRLLENKERWKKVCIEIDQVAFISLLNKIRGIRNDIMHFDPDGLEDTDLEILRKFTKFLTRLRKINAI